MRLVDAVLAFHPEVLKYEKNKKGAPNRKLESLAQLNGFVSHDAHDALGDVRATIFIAQLIKDRCPQLWSEYMTSRSKHLFEDALYQTGQFELVDSYSRQRVGATLCSGEDGQVFLCFDLVFAASCANDDPQSWLQEFANQKPSPFFRVKTNSASFVRPISRNELKQAKHSLPIDHALALFDQLSSNPGYISKLKLAERSSRPNYPQKEGVENLIYSGFSSASDQRLMAEFHRLPVQDRARFLGQLEDQRFRSLGMRLIAENWPETLPSNKLAEHRSWVNARLNTPGSGNTIKDELLRAKEALAVCSIQEQPIIQNIIQYYVSLSASAGGSICPRSD